MQKPEQKICSKCNRDFPIMEIDSNFHSNGYCLLTDEDKRTEKSTYFGLGLFMLGTILSILIMSTLYQEYHELSILFGILCGLPIISLSTLVQLGYLDNLFKKNPQHNLDKGVNP